MGSSVSLTGTVTGALTLLLSRRVKPDQIPPKCTSSLAHQASKIGFCKREHPYTRPIILSNSSSLTGTAMDVQTSSPSRKARLGQLVQKYVLSGSLNFQS